jgi:hypothetical protein
MTYGKQSLTIAAAATGMLLAAGSGVATGTTHARGAHIRTPHLSVTITTTGHGDNASQTMTVQGPRKVSAGRVAISLHAVGGEAEVGVVRIKKGHTFKEASGLFAAFGQSAGPNGPTPAGLADLRKVVKIVTFFGGLDSGSGARVHGTVVLPKAGTYLVLNDSNGPSDPTKLKVTAKAGHRTAPKSTATVRTLNTKRFAGSLVLPAKGTITFKNTATNSPHFLLLQHVKAGTTRKQVIQDFSSNGKPKSVLQDGVGTDVLSPGHAQTLSYNLPKGDYAEACFFPDLQTGMPHAFMGMVRIVHLK